MIVKIKKKQFGCKCTGRNFPLTQEDKRLYPLIYYLKCTKLKKKVALKEVFFFFYQLYYKPKRPVLHGSIHCQNSYIYKTFYRA